MVFNYRNKNNEILTHVEVNNKTKKVNFQNFTDDPMDCAFGVRKEVTYDDVLYFFEKRTFPRNRSDLKDILKWMGLKEYDPYRMCKKLEGRTAQDEDWIEFISD